MYIRVKRKKQKTKKKHTQTILKQIKIRQLKALTPHTS
uniref:Uncharacterized protein n=1 Tax=Rhizophora mucronata TaxID=61149 RepID=A0A2P2IL96_RHIMU